MLVGGEWRRGVDLAECLALGAYIYMCWNILTFKTIFLPLFYFILGARPVPVSLDKIKMHD